MTICFIVGAFPSLSETFIIDQMAGLLEQGHSIRIFAGAHSSDLVIDERVARLDLMSRVRYYNDRPRSFTVRLLCFFYLFPAHFGRASGALWNAVNVFRFGQDALSLNLFFRALRFLEVRDYDVIFCHFGQNGLVGLQMKDAGVIRGKLVTVFHASDISSFVRREGVGIYKDLFERADRFLPVSRHAREKLLALGCPDKKILIQHMGVDLSKFSFGKRPRLNATALRLLSVARLVEKKGLCYGLEAVTHLVRAGIDCQYTIVGDGVLRQQLEAQARQAGITARVMFTGWQTPVEMRRLMDQADIFLAPSLTAADGNEEGIPVVIMEAMASGLPVIAALTGGIGELVIDGQTGFLINEKDARSMADKILFMLANPRVVAGVVLAGREIVETQHSARELNLSLDRLLWQTAADGKN